MSELGGALIQLSVGQTAWSGLSGTGSKAAEQIRRRATSSGLLLRVFDLGRADWGIVRSTLNMLQKSPRGLVEVRRRQQFVNLALNTITGKGL